MSALDWAATRLGSPVVAHRDLDGGSTSRIVALRTDDGRDAVLRLVTNEPWRTHGAELTTRESWTQAQLAATDVPAPRTLALDADGEHCGHPAHLMTLLPGRTDVDRVDDASLGQAADLLARIHDVVPSVPARDYQTWAPPVKFVVPVWAREPTAWLTAFDVLRGQPPLFEPTFLHRDFAPRNLLWEPAGITGVVDWVETSTGPAWLDVAHCRTNLVLSHGHDRAEAFVGAYVGRTGTAELPWFDVMDVVGFLPTPGRPRPEAVTDPAARRRLEEHLVRVLAGLNRG